MRLSTERYFLYEKEILLKYFNSFLKKKITQILNLNNY